jgi:hypothetical protein
MSSKFRNVALLLPAFVLATGLASAQPGVKVSTVNSDGSVTTTSIQADTSGGPGAKSPVFSSSATPGLPYWDVLSLAGTSTNYYNQVPYLTAPPNPSIAVGPDDIILVVNRTISRYPNPNAAGNSGPTNPYNYLATEMVPLDVWMGLNLLGGNNSAAALCPSGTSSNTACVIDNASVRYDQMIGRYVVLFTVTDMAAHRSNFVLVTSNFAQFLSCGNTGASCPGGASSSPFFTTPVIAPVVGGTSTGGSNTKNWTMVTIPINLLYNPNQQPSALGLVNNSNATPPFNNALANSAVGTLNTISTGGSTGVNFLTVPFCPNGGPALPLTYGPALIAPNIPTSLGAGGTARTCTNYFPTSARFGLDNDNIILTSAVLDQAFSPNEGNFPAIGTPGQGPYAGTRVVTVPKLAVYNGFQPNLAQPPGCLPATCQAVNLADDSATGTLSVITTQIAFGQGTVAAPPVAAGDLQYGAGSPTTPNSCATSLPLVVPSLSTGAGLSCAPTAANPKALPPTFWEPDNLRGRALASFDSQVSVFGLGNLASQFSGVITPIDYLVGTQITDNFGAGVVPTGVSGITGQPPSIIPAPGITPPTAGIGTKYYLQPVVFSCPSGVLLLESVSFCGTGVNGGQALVSDLSLLGTLIKNMGTLTQLADPSPVGQGFSATQMTTSPANTPVTPTTNERIFVGDSRPEQVMFREGLLYVARSIRQGDLSTPINWMGTSTVLYDIIKTCATGATLPTCGAYSVTGNLGSPNLAYEYTWFNGTSVPDPNGDINGFGFYQPMFEVPADVISSGPVSPISTLQLFDKLFVGMTTGGTSNTAGIFSKNFPSLWDFRPGDDAFDTIEPYLDPYTGVVKSTYQCGGDITVSVTSKSGNNITVVDPTGLGAGMYLSGTQTQIVSIAGNVVTLSAAFTGTTFPASATFTRVQPLVGVTATLVTPGSNQITVASTTGLAIGQIVASGTVTSSLPVGNVGTTAYTCTVAPCPPSSPPAVGNLLITPSATSFGIKSLTNVGLAEKIAGVVSGSISTTTVLGNANITVPGSTQVAPGEAVTGTNISGTITPTGITLNPDGTLTLTLSALATASGATTVKIDSTNCFSGTANVTGTTNASAFVVGGANVPGVTNGGTIACTSYYVDGVNGSTTGQAAAVVAPILLGAIINNGIPVNFSTTGLITGTSTTIINIAGNTVTLSAPAAAPLPGLLAGVTTTNVPINFVTSGSTAQVTCPIIPFSARGGASTDPNDGSLWLFGEFAKNRLSTIPGPGQWGTSVANYALSFPAVDAYGNDNTYFQDVQPPTAAVNPSPFFTWIQLAKNVGIGVASQVGPCVVNNGNAPILQPPVSGTTPTPSPSTLGCPYFLPTALVTRAEMSYWVVKAQMDEAQITNFLCATGGDPSGLSPQCGGGGAVSTFADVGPAGSLITDPFVVAANPSLGIAGVSSAQLLRYIEVMGRRGYSKGCGNTFDLQANFCPNANVTRAQMAAFIIRAKMSNVFPTTLSGALAAVIGAPYGDAFGPFTAFGPYFTDEPASDPFFPYIQKMRELRITNGTGSSAYSPNNTLTRQEIATFIMRAFFL